MYLAYSPPQMLPTQTLNPTEAASTAGSTATGSAKFKRNVADVGGFAERSNRKTLKKRTEPHDADRWWWIGVGMTTVGGVAYFYF